MYAAMDAGLSTGGTAELWIVVESRASWATVLELKLRNYRNFSQIAKPRGVVVLLHVEHSNLPPVQCSSSLCIFPVNMHTTNVHISRNHAH